MNPIAREGAHQAAPWVALLARLGLVAKGVLYMMIGALAALAALGHGGKADADKHDAMTTLIRAPFGRALIAAIAVGLAGYALWKFLEGILDPEHRGTVKRIASVGLGIFTAALTYSAAMLAFANRDTGSGGDKSEHWTARALALPYGVYLLWAVAGGLVIYGLYQLACAIRAKLEDNLDLTRLSRGAYRVVVGVSRFGIAARGVVFCTIGILLGRAAERHDPQAAGGLRDSLRELIALGRWPFVTIALGLAAYGIYELVNARYRRIRVA
jgi:hypothetical protein